MTDNNLEKLLKEPQEELKWKVQYAWFCTVFKKKNNKPLFTFDTLDGFSEGHWKAIAIMQGAMWSISKELFQVFREYVNQTWKLNKEAKELVTKFDKIFRVLASTK